MAKICGLMLLLLVGCGKEVVVDVPAEKTVDVEAFIASVDTQARVLTTTLAAQKLTGEQTLETAQAIMAKLNTLEASLVESKSVRKEDDQQSALNPPAKANTASAPLKVATPGDSSETLVELATRLYAQGVNTHMKTREELEAIDANLTASKSSPVQFYSRPTYSEPAGTICVNGRCFVPQVSSRRGRR